MRLIEPSVESRVFLTFDDGGASAYDPIARLVEQCGWRAHFFVPTDWIGSKGFLNSGQVLELDRRGHLIGSHSCSHPSYSGFCARRILLTESSGGRGASRYSDAVYVRTYGRRVRGRGLPSLGPVLGPPGDGPGVVGRPRGGQGGVTAEADDAMENQTRGRVRGRQHIQARTEGYAQPVIAHLNRRLERFDRWLKRQAHSSGSLVRKRQD